MVGSEKSKEKCASFRVSADLEWLIDEAPGLLGLHAQSYDPKSTSSGASPEPLCSDEQLGWGRWKESGGIVARFRRLWRVWSHVDRAHQDVLAAFYDTSKLGAFARTAGNLRSPTARKRRVLWYLECKDTTARRPEDADAPVWSADDEAEAEEAIQVAHEAWEEARAKVRGSEKTKSHSDTILTELGA